MHRWDKNECMSICVCVYISASFVQTIPLSPKSKCTHQFRFENINKWIWNILWPIALRYASLNWQANLQLINWVANPISIICISITIVQVHSHEIVGFSQLFFHTIRWIPMKFHKFQIFRAPGIPSLSFTIIQWISLARVQCNRPRDRNFSHISFIQHLIQTFDKRSIIFDYQATKSKGSQS